MFRLAPIDNDFVPYGRRRVRKNNAGLFVKSRRRGGANARASRFVGLASVPPPCLYPCQRCPGGMICTETGGFCVDPNSPDGQAALARPDCGIP
jgi:hypothetical protein